MRAPRALLTRGEGTVISAQGKLPMFFITERNQKHEIYLFIKSGWEPRHHLSLDNIVTHEWGPLPPKYGTWLYWIRFQLQNSGTGITRSQASFFLNTTTCHQSNKMLLDNYWTLYFSYSESTFFNKEPQHIELCRFIKTTNLQSLCKTLADRFHQLDFVQVQLSKLYNVPQLLPSGKEVKKHHQISPM